MTDRHDWFCCQLGAREHYSFARALHTKGMLGGLVTDAWVPSGHPLGWLRRNLRERYHPELASAPVRAWNVAAVAFELAARWRGLRGWPLILERNRWFQKKTVATLSELLSSQILAPSSQPILFAYSYAALEIFGFARQQGWKIIMSQIDGGMEDERIVERAHRSRPELRSRWQPAPAEYWSQWREECALADAIVVNSDWSRGLLEKAGVRPNKLHVIPVAFDDTVRIGGFQRYYPAEFTRSRPLKVLFLGAFVVRKGAAAVLDAIELLSEDPITFSIVGSVDVQVPVRFQEMPKVRWIGPVSRESTAEHYRECDVFLFPTVSDGFGMTQVEARAWKLPIIATPFCAPIVQHGVNGLVISEVTGSCLAEAIRGLLHDPKRLKRLADGTASEYQSYHPDRVRNQILALGAGDRARW